MARLIRTAGYITATAALIVGLVAVIAPDALAADTTITVDGGQGYLVRGPDLTPSGGTVPLTLDPNVIYTLSTRVPGPPGPATGPSPTSRGS
jgi:hypothetical protein